MLFAKPRTFDNRPDDSWDALAIAKWAADQIVNHEEICAQRWGVLIKLMWAALSGIGAIFLMIASNYVAYVFSIIKAH